MTKQTTIVVTGALRVKYSDVIPGLMNLPTDLACFMVSITKSLSVPFRKAPRVSRSTIMTYKRTCGTLRMSSVVYML